MFESVEFSEESVHHRLHHICQKPPALRAYNLSLTAGPYVIVVIDVEIESQLSVYRIAVVRLQQIFLFHFVWALMDGSQVHGRWARIEQIPLQIIDFFEGLVVVPVISDLRSVDIDKCDMPIVQIAIKPLLLISISTTSTDVHQLELLTTLTA